MRRNLLHRSLATLLGCLMVLTASLGIAPPDASAGTSGECVVYTSTLSSGATARRTYCRVSTIDWDAGTTTVGPWEFISLTVTHAQ